MAKIYISSTYEDLKEYRESVYKTLRQMKYDVVAMEDYLASDERPLDKCLNDVSCCEIYIGIFALRYGYIPPDKNMSITELEYRKAKEDNKKIFIFILDKKAKWDQEFIDFDPEKMPKLLNLKKELMENHLCKFFNSPDNLSKLVSLSLQGNIDPEVFTLKESYLNWILEESGIVSLAGIDPQAAKQKREELNLGSIYTALVTFSSQEKDILSKQIKESNREKIKYYSALEMLNKHKHLVLLGDPGSGKSTFVNFVSCCLAGEALKNDQVNIDVLTAPLPDDKGKDSKNKQKWDHGELLPVRVILRDFVSRGLKDSCEKDCAEILWNFIETELKKSMLEKFIPYLEKELRNKGGLILLDGLDEVPEANDRRIQIKKIIDDFKSVFHKCRILVTSRTYAYQKQDWQIPGLKEAVLAPFTNGQIRRFIDRWYAHIAELRRMDKEDAQGRAELLKYVIFHNDRLKELADRPLILTLMASLHAWRGGSLPEKREELYSNTVDLLLDWWESPKVVKGEDGEYKLIQPGMLEWLKTDRDKVRRVLDELAFKAHEKQPELVGTADIDENELITGIIKVSNNPEVKPLRLIEFLRDRAGILISRGVSIYTFPHRTFQEYMSACHLTQKGYPKNISKLVKADPNRWREVALLSGAKSSRGGQYGVWALAEELCYKDILESKITIQDIWGGYLAGQILAETANLEDLSDKEQKSLYCIKKWLLRIMSGSELPAIERVKAGNLLDKLGDFRFKSEYYYLEDDPMLGFVEIPEGEFLMGSDPGKDKELYDDEKPQHKLKLSRYYISRYPVTVSQYRKYLEVSKKEISSNWKKYNQYGNHPVVFVKWYEAVEYCEWLTDQLKKSSEISVGIRKLLQESDWEIRLPSETEWEKAARGKDGRIYPWGDKFDNDRLNFTGLQLGTTSSVGCFGKGASPYNVFEMSGNVWEWTLSIWGKNWRSPDFKYPYRYNDGREDMKIKDTARVARGGAWINDASYCRAALRPRCNPCNRDVNRGFRLCFAPRSAGK